MSVLIKGMEMPKNCDRCFFCHYIHADEDHEHFYVCSLENWNKPITHLPINPIQAKSKPDWCPLEPVVHGHWIEVDEQPYFRKHFHTRVCSVCRKKKDGNWSYCPNCGARMGDDE